MTIREHWHTFIRWLRGIRCKACGERRILSSNGYCIPCLRVMVCAAEFQAAYLEGQNECLRDALKAFGAPSHLPVENQE